MWLCKLGNKALIELFRLLNDLKHVIELRMQFGFDMMSLLVSPHPFDWKISNKKTQFEFV